MLNPVHWLARWFHDKPAPIPSPPPGSHGDMITRQCDEHEREFVPPDAKFLAQIPDGSGPLHVINLHRLNCGCYLLRTWRPGKEPLCVLIPPEVLVRMGEAAASPPAKTAPINYVTQRQSLFSRN